MINDIVRMYKIYDEKYRCNYIDSNTGNCGSINMDFDTILLGIEEHQIN